MSRLASTLLVATAFVAVLASSAEAASVQVAACATIINSLDADWQATRALLRRYGPAYEANPIIRLIGADPYFATLTLVAGRTCRETTAWRWAAVGVWLVQSWAVSTHIPFGTASRLPVLIFTVWGD